MEAGAEGEDVIGEDLLPSAALLPALLPPGRPGVGGRGDRRTHRGASRAAPKRTRKKKRKCCAVARCLRGLGGWTGGGGWVGPRWSCKPAQLGCVCFLHPPLGLTATNVALVDHFWQIGEWMDHVLISKII